VNLLLTFNALFKAGRKTFPLACDAATDRAHVQIRNLI
jgi:hypothetical protein